tara:strand:+ start:102 stop:407 length:306 start_codon:yes stop_codon:yes gene_type:complete
MIILAILAVTHISMTITIIFGDLAGKELVVSGTLVALTLIGSFGLIRVTKNFKLLLLEMDDKLANTNFGKETKEIPVDRLGIVFAALFLINAVIQLTTIYS